jgi:hypothetical protein
MIGQQITGEDGKPLDGLTLAESKYQPSDEVKQLFARVQRDYQVAYMLQHRPFDEFDGYSLLQRQRLDQETFGAFVGCQWIPKHKQWRWKGRKNNARNKIIGLLAQLVSGMLFPYVMATNDRNEEDQMTARIMRILVENHLRKAGYETKFMFMVLSALVNPAVLVQVEYVVAFQRVKEKLTDGSVNIIEAVDEIMTGLNLNIIPVDELLVADFYTGDIQRQPFLIRVRRIPWDEARKKYADKYHDENGVDLFDYVQAGKTRVVLTGQEGQTLYDIEWTEADKMYVQEMTAYYRDEDLEVTFVGGVFMGNQTNVYNTNPFNHRRFSLVGDRWISVPVYEFAKSGFEAIDPSGRFFYYKSAAFKEYWEDASINKMNKLLHDGTELDVIKPTIISGIAKTDSTVIVPGATISLPKDATMQQYGLGPNLPAAYNLINEQKQDLSESTLAPIMEGQMGNRQTAFAVSAAVANAKIVISLTSLMIADLIRQIGMLTMDEIIMKTTVGEIDATIPEAPRLKYKEILARTKEKGRNLTNRIQFTDSLMRDDLTEGDINTLEWGLFDKAGGVDSEQRIFHVSPYKFARTQFEFYVDAAKITDRSLDSERQKKAQAFQMLTDQRVLPYVNMENVVDDFVIDEYSDGDPDRYKKPVGQDEMLSSMMGPQAAQAPGQPPQAAIPGQQPNPFALSNNH